MYEQTQVNRYHASTTLSHPVNPVNWISTHKKWMPVKPCGHRAIGRQWWCLQRSTICMGMSRYTIKFIMKRHIISYNWAERSLQVSIAQTNIHLCNVLEYTYCREKSDSFTQRPTHGREPHIRSCNWLAVPVCSGMCKKVRIIQSL